MPSGQAVGPANQRCGVVEPRRRRRGAEDSDGDPAPARGPHHGGVAVVGGVGVAGLRRQGLPAVDEPVGRPEVAGRLAQFCGLAIR